MTTRSIRIPDEVDARLVAAADAEHISVNAFVVRAVEASVAERDHRASVAAAYRRVKARNPFIDSGGLDELERQVLGGGR